jgi:hypothetical protein
MNPPLLGRDAGGRFGNPPPRTIRHLGGSPDGTESVPPDKAAGRGRRRIRLRRGRGGRDASVGARCPPWWPRTLGRAIRAAHRDGRFGGRLVTQRVRQHADSRANGRFVDPLSLIIRDGLGSCVSQTQANGLAASDADCSNAAFFSAHPFAPQFSSSQVLIRSSREPRPSAGTPIRIRAGKRHSDSAHEAGTGGRTLPFDSAGRSHIPPNHSRPLRKPWRSPDRGFLSNGWDSCPNGAIEDTTWEPDPSQLQRRSRYALGICRDHPILMPFGRLSAAPLWEIGLQYGRGGVLFGPVGVDLTGTV